MQSLDGVLSVFEQDSAAFRRQLPASSFLIPGPMIYLPKSDTFVTTDSAMFMHAYRYSVLASASDNVGEQAKQVGTCPQRGSCQRGPPRRISYTCCSYGADVAEQDEIQSPQSAICCT